MDLITDFITIGSTHLTAGVANNTKAEFVLRNLAGAEVKIGPNRTPDNAPTGKHTRSRILDPIPRTCGTERLISRRSRSSGSTVSLALRIGISLEHLGDLRISDIVTTSNQLGHDVRGDGGCARNCRRGGDGDGDWPGLVSAGNGDDRAAAAGSSRRDRV